MKPLSIQEIRQAVGGRALSPATSASAPVTAVCTDSRRMEPSSLFIALRGDRFDGHDFLPTAAAGGAVAALVEHPPVSPQPNVHLIQVSDTRAAMGKLARHVRKQMRGQVIAVAGSNGKTSTKHLIQAALATKRGSISPKSYNNDIGVPLTIFAADPSQDYLVLEMGTNHPGEIRALAEMALPNVAVITSIGAEHLEGLGDLMGVRQENASIVAGLNSDGLLIFNGDDEELRRAVAAFAGRKITFGFGSNNDLFATAIECTTEGVNFKLNNSRRSVFVPMLGRHSAANALAAIAVARRMGLREDVVIEGLAHAHGPEMRLQLEHLPGGITLLNDAYNANPSSMRAAMETAAALPARRRVVVLGDMRELGPSTERYHREIGRLVADFEFDLLLCVGTDARWIADEATRAGVPTENVRRFANSRSAARRVPATLRRGDLVLLKASRSVRLEEIAQAIRNTRPPMRKAG